MFYHNDDSKVEPILAKKMYGRHNLILYMKYRMVVMVYLKKKKRLGCCCYTKIHKQGSRRQAIGLSKLEEIVLNSLRFRILLLGRTGKNQNIRWGVEQIPFLFR